MLYIKDGKIKDSSRIIIFTEEFQIINPTEEQLLADGWKPYVPPTPKPHEPTKDELINDYMETYVTESINQRNNMDNTTALKYSIFVYPWEKYIGKELPKGRIVSYSEKLWRCRKGISEVLEIYPPSLNTAADYEVIDKEHEGTQADPIPYTPPMEIFEGKYYIQNEVIYKCTRDSGQALTHDLSALIGLYVELV